MTDWRVILASCLVLACLLAGCGTPGRVGVSATYDMQPQPPEVSASVDWHTSFRGGSVSMSLSTTGAMSTRVRVYLP